MRGRLALPVILILGAAAPAVAQEVGMAIVVQPRVRAYPPRGEPSYELKERNLIERGLKVRLEDRESLLKIAFTREFGCRRITFSGQRTQAISGVLKVLGRSELETEDPSRPCEPRLKFNLGKLWLALAPGEPPVDVETPNMVAGVKGTLVRILVDPAFGTFLAVDEGTVTVRAKTGGPPVGPPVGPPPLGPPVEVAAGQWVLVPPGGSVLPPSLLVPGGPEIDAGEPFTDPPGLNPGQRPILDLPKGERP